LHGNQSAGRCARRSASVRHGNLSEVHLHQSGDAAEATRLLAEAERLQVKRQSKYSTLYPVEGHLYCDPLLGPGETEEVRSRASQVLPIAELETLRVKLAS